MLEWLFGRKGPASSTPVYFHNTLGNKREEFSPRGNTVRMYNCGPTVYDKQQIGNLSAAVFADTIRRVLEYNGYEVKQVINITDFGHLSGDNEGDADQGEDRMTKGLRREGLPITMEGMKELAARYTDQYLRDITALNVEVKKIQFPRASEYVAGQIALIKTIEEKGYAYGTKDGVYFDTKKFAPYGALGGIDLGALKEGARIEQNPEKKNPTDFALWKKDPSLGWESPWGKGFPGWHIECSAMARSLLGEQIDIHTGGVEHIGVHHNNEIAQSEVATGKSPFARYWMHRSHIQLEGKKISKSIGNTLYLSDIVERGVDPLALRYWFQTAHYRAHANFTWEALEGAASALKRLHRTMSELAKETAAPYPPAGWQRRFQERINDDLDTPGAIAVMWEMLNEKKHSPAELKAALLDFDKVLGIGLADVKPAEEVVAPEDVVQLLKEREEARKAKDFDKADKLRDEIKAKGFEVKDGENGPKLEKITA